MESRKILIANTKTQRRNEVITDATTLGELKAALDRENIDYSDMTFTEGISKTQLLDDETQLPQNVMYKGQPTNNLVILLTNTKKKIASGISAGDRKAAYSIIKEQSLQDAVKSAFGRNFTQVPTADLQKFIEKHTGDSKPSTQENNSKESSKEEVLDNTEHYPVSNLSNLENAKVSPVAISIFNMLTSLIDNNALNSYEAHWLSVYLVKKVSDNKPHVEAKDMVSSKAPTHITDDDIDDMIDDLNL